MFYQGRVHPGRHRARRGKAMRDSSRTHATRSGHATIRSAHVVAPDRRRPQEGCRSVCRGRSRPSRLRGETATPVSSTPVSSPPRESDARHARDPRGVATQPLRRSRARVVVVALGRSRDLETGPRGRTSRTEGSWASPERSPDLGRVPPSRHRGRTPARTKPLISGPGRSSIPQRQEPGPPNGGSGASQTWPMRDNSRPYDYRRFGARRSREARGALR